MKASSCDHVTMSELTSSDHLETGHTVLTASYTLATTNVDQRSVHVGHVAAAVTMATVWSQLTHQLAVDTARSSSTCDTSHGHCHAHGGTCNMGNMSISVNI